MSTLLTRLRPLLAAGVAVTLLGTGAGAATSAESALVLDHGHVDAFSVFYDNQELTLELQEDVTGNHVRHAPEDVSLHVVPDASMTLPDPLPANLSFLSEYAGQDVYFLPQTQDQAIVWPGWSTESLPAGVFANPIDIEVVGVDGPGEAFLWQSGSFGQTISVLEGGGQQLPGVIPTNVNAHVHANWVFTAPGTYELTARASANLVAGGTATSETRTYTFQVGELPVEEPVTTLSVTGGDGHYHVGDEVTLTAQQDPATDLDHYHWFTRTSPDAEWTIVPGVGGAEYTFTVTDQHEGLQVQARLYGDGHAVVAESAPVALDVHVEDPSEPSFNDVPEGLTFHDEIIWLAGTKITTGYEDGTFRPSAPVLREQMAAFLYRLQTLVDGEAPEVELPAGGSPFVDVPTSHTFYKEIVWLESTGISTGYADGTFRPSQPVLREQMAAFLYRFDGQDAPATGPASFVDVPATHTFYDEIQWLAGTKITTGYTENGVTTYRGSQAVLREQMAAFLFRYDELKTSQQ